MRFHKDDRHSVPRRATRSLSHAGSGSREGTWVLSVNVQVQVSGWEDYKVTSAHAQGWLVGQM